MLLWCHGSRRWTLLRPQGWWSHSHIKANYPFLICVSVTVWFCWDMRPGVGSWPGCNVSSANTLFPAKTHTRFSSLVCSLVRRWEDEEPIHPLWFLLHLIRSWPIFTSTPLTWPHNILLASLPQNLNQAFPWTHWQRVILGMGTGICELSMFIALMRGRGMGLPDSWRHLVLNTLLSPLYSQDVYSGPPSEAKIQQVIKSYKKRVEAVIFFCKIVMWKQNVTEHLPNEGCSGNGTPRFTWLFYSPLERWLRDLQTHQWVWRDFTKLECPDPEESQAGWKAGCE